MNLKGTVEGERGGGRVRGFSLTPTRVKSGQASHHSARRGFPRSRKGKLTCKWNGEREKGG
jgi:hypothetical protein